MSLLLEALKQAERENRQQNPAGESGLEISADDHHENQDRAECDFELLEPDPECPESAGSGEFPSDTNEPVQDLIGDSGGAAHGQEEMAEAARNPNPVPEASRQPEPACEQTAGQEPPPILDGIEDFDPGSEAATGQVRSDEERETDSVTGSDTEKGNETELGPASVAHLLDLSRRSESRNRLLFALVAMILLIGGMVAYRILMVSQWDTVADAVPSASDAEPAVDYPDPMQTEDVLDISRLRPVREYRHPIRENTINVPDRLPDVLPGPAGGDRSVPLDGDMTTDQESPGTTATGEGETEKVSVRVRTLGETARSRRIREAYRLLSRGDIDAARRLYGSILSAHPDDRDALLGLASAEMAHGRADEARRLFRQVLESDPDNPYAREGLSLLSGRIGPEQTPDGADPGLLAARASMHARRGRWKEAQALYFRAHVADPDNPVAFYGLAVSLDHLGKRRAALDYYRKALESGVPGIDGSAIMRRIMQLEQQIPGVSE